MRPIVSYIYAKRINSTAPLSYFAACDQRTVETTSFAMATKILTNGRFYAATNDQLQLASGGAIVLKDGLISHVGKADDEAISSARDSGAVEIDLKDRVVTPGFMDGHVHLMGFGLSLDKPDLIRCKNLDDIRAVIADYAKANPTKPRIVCKSWIQHSTRGMALASMLDDLDPRPIFIEAFDFHSVWCNSAALKELKVEDMKDPPGGSIERDETGKASGLLLEGAFHGIAMPYLNQSLTDSDRQTALGNALAAYSAAGYTGLIDMSMDEEQWEALKTFKATKGLPLHIAAYWMVRYSDKPDEVDASLQEAIEMLKKYPPSADPSFCITGIKLISDGVVDSCTAALSKPYIGKEDPTEPIWPSDALKKVVAQADAAGLQCAVHAIGDRAISQALGAYESIPGKPTKRHRIEHLELSSERDAKRLGELGIIASVQPVHSDPVLLRGWPELIGQHRCQRQFAYQQFLDGGAKMALGTDVPTAPHPVLPNLYHATTRRSVMEPESEERTTPHFAISIASALTAATEGAAYSRYAETFTGSLKPDMSADLVVIDTDLKPEELLKAKVVSTFYKGKTVFGGS